MSRTLSSPRPSPDPLLETRRVLAAIEELAERVEQLAQLTALVAYQPVRRPDGLFYDAVRSPEMMKALRAPEGLR
ncbi:MAG TPA: hypothetical protein VFQ90_07315 [Stellaceae bacterium]|jgi:hypothetical protein|nr:hypothetical protein [Stellaceae bacterium]